MAKTTADDYSQYNKKTQIYREAIETILKREKSTLTDINQNPAEGVAFKRLALAEDMLNLTSNYIILNSVSLSMLKAKNEDALNDGRKYLYTGLTYLEAVVGNFVDAPYSDYEDKLAALESLNAAQRYLLIRKMGLTIELLENAYGDNSKWRWSFVDLEGRFAAAAKNILDLKAVVVNSDPTSPNYEATVYHLRTVKRLLTEAADRYREKYELSTNEPEDFMQGIYFLGALRRIHILLGEREDAEMIKKKQEVWTAKLKTDSKKKADSEQKKR
ncbi:hypothetical protein FACS1894142_0980 [Spirochaetia bacterium]|nr:hypothetical protein FACS1894142_0980 [Spirochaetia bacterium]